MLKRNRVNRISPHPLSRFLQIEAMRRQLAEEQRREIEMAEKRRADEGRERQRVAAEALALARRLEEEHALERANAEKVRSIPRRR